MVNVDSLFSRTTTGKLVFRGDVEGDAVSVAVEFVPSRTGSVDIGSVTLFWRDAYVQRWVGSSLVPEDGADITLEGNLGPDADNARDLGSAAVAYRDVYAHNLHARTAAGTYDKAALLSDLPVFLSPLQESLLGYVSLGYDDISLKVNGAGELYVASVATATGSLYAQAPLLIGSTSGGDPLMQIQTNASLHVASSSLAVDWTYLPTDGSIDISSLGQWYVATQAPVELDATSGKVGLSHDVSLGVVAGSLGVDWSRFPTDGSIDYGTSLGEWYVATQAPIELDATSGKVGLSHDDSLEVVSGSVGVDWTRLPTDGSIDYSSSLSEWQVATQAPIELDPTSGKVTIAYEDPLYIDTDTGKLGVLTDGISIHIAENTNPFNTHLKKGVLYVQPDEFIFLGSGLSQSLGLDALAHTMTISVNLYKQGASNVSGLEFASDQSLRIRSQGTNAVPFFSSDLLSGDADGFSYTHASGLFVFKATLQTESAITADYQIPHKHYVDRAYSPAANSPITITADGTAKVGLRLDGTMTVTGTDSKSLGLNYDPVYFQLAGSPQVLRLNLDTAHFTTVGSKVSVKINPTRILYGAGDSVATSSAAFTYEPASGTLGVTNVTSTGNLTGDRVRSAQDASASTDCVNLGQLKSVHTGWLAAGTGVSKTYNATTNIVTFSGAYSGGTGITISGSTISGSYVGGNGVSISGNVISAVNFNPADGSGAVNTALQDGIAAAVGGGAGVVGGAVGATVAGAAFNAVGSLIGSLSSGATAMIGAAAGAIGGAGAGALTGFFVGQAGSAKNDGSNKKSDDGVGFGKPGEDNFAVTVSSSGDAYAVYTATLDATNPYQVANKGYVDGAISTALGGGSSIAVTNPVSLTGSTVGLKYDNATVTLDGSNQIRVNPNLTLSTITTGGGTSNAAFTFADTADTNFFASPVVFFKSKGGSTVASGGSEIGYLDFRALDASTTPVNQRSVLVIAQSGAPGAGYVPGYFSVYCQPASTGAMVQAIGADATGLRTMGDLVATQPWVTSQAYLTSVPVFSPVTNTSGTIGLAYDNSTVTLDGSNRIRVNPNLGLTTLTVSGLTTLTSRPTLADGLTATGGAIVVDKTLPGAILNVRNGASNGSKNRWSWQTVDAETGTGTAGSNLVLYRYNDAATVADATFTVSRATGNLTVPSITAQGGGVSSGIFTFSDGQDNAFFDSPLIFSKSKNNGGTVSSGSEIGYIDFRAHDSSSTPASQRSLLMIANAGTPGSGYVPGSLSVYCQPPSSSAIVKAMRVDSSGVYSLEQLVATQSWVTSQAYLTTVPVSDPVSSTSGTIGLKYDNSTVTLNGSGQVRVNPDLTLSSLTAGYASVGGDIDSAGDITSTASPSGGLSHTIHNTSTSSGAFAMFVAKNNAGSGMTLFLNGTNRTSDGGSNTGTLRNDAGALRLQALGNKGLSVSGTTGNVTFDGTITSAGSISVGSDLVATRPWVTSQGYTTAAGIPVSDPVTNASGTIGLNPVLGVTKITCTQPTASGASVDMITAKFDNNWGLRLAQYYVGAGDIHYELYNKYAGTETLAMSFMGGNTGVGTVPSGSYKLDVAGAVHTSGNATVDGTITMGGNTVATQSWVTSQGYTTSSGIPVSNPISNTSGTIGLKYDNATVTLDGSNRVRVAPDLTIQSSLLTKTVSTDTAYVSHTPTPTSTSNVPVAGTEYGWHADAMSVKIYRGAGATIDHMGWHSGSSEIARLFPDGSLHTAKGYTIDTVGEPLRWGNDSYSPALYYRRHRAQVASDGSLNAFGESTFTLPFSLNSYQLLTVTGTFAAYSRDISNNPGPQFYRAQIGEVSSQYKLVIRSWTLSTTSPTFTLDYNFQAGASQIPSGFSMNLLFTLDANNAADAYPNYNS